MSEEIADALARGRSRWRRSPLWYGPFSRAHFLVFAYIDQWSFVILPQLDSLSQQNQDKTVSVSLRSAAGRASLFHSILTTTKDENALFSSNSAESVSAAAQSDSALDSVDVGAKGLAKGGVRTRSKATVAIDI